MSNSEKAQYIENGSLSRKTNYMVISSSFFGIFHIVCHDANFSKMRFFWLLKPPVGGPDGGPKKMEYSPITLVVEQSKTKSFLVPPGAELGPLGMP